MKSKEQRRLEVERFNREHRVKALIFAGIAVGFCVILTVWYAALLIWPGFYPNQFNWALLLAALVVPCCMGLAFRQENSYRIWRPIGRNILGCCPQCGYSLEGHPGKLGTVEFVDDAGRTKIVCCPECGKESEVLNEEEENKNADQLRSGN